MLSIQPTNLGDSLLEIEINDEEERDLLKSEGGEQIDGMVSL